MTHDEFEGVVAGCRDRLHEVARRYVMDEETAKDVVQTVLEQLATCVPTINLAGAKELAFASVKNAAINVYNSGYRKFIKVGLPLTADEADDNEDGFDPPPLHLSYEPDEAKRVDVRRAIASLPPRQALLAVMIHIEGYTMEEVGAWLGVSKMTISRQVEEANAALRELLSEYEP